MGKKLLGLLLVVIMALSLAGCGGGPPAKPQANQQETEKKAPVNSTVTVGFVAMTGGSPQAFINQKYGVFTDTLKPLGKEVKYAVVHGLQEVYPLLDGGKADFIYMPQTAFTTYVTKNSKFGGSGNYVMIAGSNTINDTNLVMRPELKSLKDLDGKKVGIANLRYADEYQLNKMLGTVGLKTKSNGGTVEVVWDDIVSKLWDNYKAKKYDAIVIFDNANNLPTVLKMVPGSNVLTLNPDGMFGKQQPRVWLVTKKALIKDDPELVKTFLKAHVLSTEKAMEKIAELPGINREMRVSWFTGKVPQARLESDNKIEKFERAWKSAGITYDPNMKYVTELVDYMVLKGYAKGVALPDFAQIDLLNAVLKEMGKPTV